MPRSRWPHWVYGSGEEPDYRFSFANERTFLAWIRTALALIAGGVALDTLDLSMPALLQAVAAGALVVLGVICAVAAWARWALAERAIRRRASLPASSVTVLVAAGVTGVAACLLLVLL